MPPVHFPASGSGPFDTGPVLISNAAASRRFARLTRRASAWPSAPAGAVLSSVVAPGGCRIIPRRILS